jgi:hypothetical protein
MDSRLQSHHKECEKSSNDDGRGSKGSCVIAEGSYESIDASYTRRHDIDNGCPDESPSNVDMSSIINPCSSGSASDISSGNMTNSTPLDGVTGSSLGGSSGSSDSSGSDQDAGKRPPSSSRTSSNTISDSTGSNGNSDSNDNDSNSESGSSGESGEHGNSSPDHDLDGLLSISKKQKGDYEDSVAITSASTISQR